MLISFAIFTSYVIIQTTKYLPKHVINDTCRYNLINVQIFAMKHAFNQTAENIEL